MEQPVLYIIFRWAFQTQIEPYIKNDISIPFVSLERIKLEARDRK